MSTTIVLVIHRIENFPAMCFFWPCTVSDQPQSMGRSQLKMVFNEGSLLTLYTRNLVRYVSEFSESTVEFYPQKISASPKMAED